MFLFTKHSNISLPVIDILHENVKKDTKNKTFHLLESVNITGLMLLDITFKSYLLTCLNDVLST